MKAKAIHVDPTVNVEMTLREAEIIKALVGGVECVTTGVVAHTIRGLFHALQDAGVSSEQTFSDLFKGKVETKVVLK